MCPQEVYGEVYYEFKEVWLPGETFNKRKTKGAKKKNTKKKKLGLFFVKKVGNQVEQAGLEFEPGI